MTILLYDQIELEEKTSKHLKVWKAWHIIIYLLAAVFGIMNYIFLLQTKNLVDDNCVFYPRQLEFHWIQRTNYSQTNDTDLPINLSEDTIVNDNKRNNSSPLDNKVENKILNINSDATNSTEEVNKGTNATQTAQNDTKLDVGNDDRVKREVQEITETQNVTTLEVGNATFINGNRTHIRVLDTTRTLFAKDSACNFTEYMPLMATVFSIIWATLFIMCPGGGRTRSGLLQQPWRILPPALLFALVMVGLTGHSFVSTNGGLHAFCEAFYNYTNATTCSSVDPLIESGWNATWGMGGRIAATRAASAGVWALWAVAAALLLARCLAAPDFAVRRTAVFLVDDPKQKVTPYLQKLHPQRPTTGSTAKQDTASVKSEPTLTTELVTVSVEHAPEWEPTPSTSTQVTIPPETKDGEESIEMTYVYEFDDRHRH